MASPTEYTHHIKVRSTQMEMPTSSMPGRAEDYDRKLRDTQEEIERIQQQREELERKKIELEELTSRKRAFVSQQVELTEKLTAFLCKKKGISPADAPLLSMEQYRQQQFDLLANGVRAALDMDAVYAAMGMDRKGGNRV